MTTAREALAEREARLAGNCREGYRLAQRDPAYRTAVLTRLQHELSAAPDDLWVAIPWTWTSVLGGTPPEMGALGPAVRKAASVLSAWFASDELIDALKLRWNEAVGDQLALGSTLRSHPFADLRSWSIRPPSAA